ncbi:sugar transporter ERD6-like 16 isoform X3 [Elaeis guineensis]|uniref:Sugar transporter ERD6-like 16 isoform X3 n=1 Tax=Elaeis guineensis var. tenera TaxID=51953 RepID=A0A6I9SEN2_ELAGV|nr:sugar transporter ERD6-like 16 isoform X3 [Elaeis guineensis]
MGNSKDVVDREENGFKEPLMHAEETRSCKESLCMVLVSTAVSVCGSFEFGVCVGYSAPTQSEIRQDLGLSLSEYSVFGSIVTIGAMIGAVTSGRISDFSGRKGAMRMSAIVCIIGWLGIYFAEGAFSLDLGRILTGYGTGVFSYVVPVFIAEIAPKQLRGGLTTINQLLICGGLSLCYIIGTLVTWRTLVLVGLVPCFVILVGLYFIPESPRWLAKVGRDRESEVALQSLRGKDADISQEAADIQEYVETLRSLPETRILELFQRTYIRSVIVGVGLMAFQQFGGVNGITFYATEIFVSAGFASGNLGTILLGSIQVPITTMGAFLMDKSGRRPLLMVSASGTCLSAFTIAISFYLKDKGIYMDWVPLLALTGILGFLGSFSIGMGAIPWVIMSEIFPINIKGVAGSLVTLVNWFASWAVSYAFNFLVSWSSSGTFFVFAAFCATSVVFVAKVVPETKGRTLEEIQASMNSFK